MQPQPRRQFYSRYCLGGTEEQMVFRENRRCLQGCLEPAVPGREQSRSGLCLVFLGVTRCDAARDETAAQPRTAEDARTTRAMFTAKGKPRRASASLPRSNCIPQGVSHGQTDREGSCSGRSVWSPAPRGPALERQQKVCATSGVDGAIHR